MEASSLPLPGPLSGRRARRKARRAARLLSDARRFERAAARVEAQLGDEAEWQVRHLRRQAGELRRMAETESGPPSAAAA